MENEKIFCRTQDKIFQFYEENKQIVHPLSDPKQYVNSIFII